MSRRPNARELLLRKELRGEDDLVDEILDDPQGPSARLFEKVKPLNDNPFKRRYIEACLLASEDYARIADMLEMDEDVVFFYSKIYFNTEGLDRLDRLQLADVRNEEERSLRLWALTEGIEFIAWRLGKRADVTLPLDGLRQLFDTCLYKAKEAFFNSNVSKASQESTRWVKLSMDIARLIKAWATDGKEAQRDLEIRVREVVATFPSVDKFQDLFTDVQSKQAEVDVPIPSGEEEGSD